MILRKTLLPIALLLVAPALLEAQKTPIQITADLTDAPRKLYHAEVDIPVTPGPVTLTTPKWIPGNHRPTGPVDDITGVVFTANGKVLPGAATMKTSTSSTSPSPPESPLFTPTSTASSPRASARNSPSSSGRNSSSIPPTRPSKTSPSNPVSKFPKAGASAPLSRQPMATTLSIPKAAPRTTPQPQSSSSKTRPSSPANTSTSSPSPPKSRPNITST